MTLLTVAALAPAVFLCIYVFKMDRNEKEPVSLLLKLLLYGALGCIPVIIIGGFLEDILKAVFPFTMFPRNVSVHLYNFLYYFIVVALVEEGVKCFIMYRQTEKHPEFNSLFDGVIYAVFVSLGFAALENVLYVTQNGWINAIMRAVLSVPGHMFYGVMMGYYYSLIHIYKKAAEYEESFIYDGYITEPRHRISHSGYTWTCLIVPTLAHGLYDFLCTMGTGLSVIMLMAFVIFMYVHCFRRISRMSQADKSDLNCVAQILFKKHPGLYEKLKNNQ